MQTINRAFRAVRSTDVPCSPLLISAFLSLLFLVVTGCGDVDYRPSAVGKEGEITIIMDTSRWNGEVGRELRDELGKYISTLPAPEPAFTLRPAGIENQFEIIKSQKNIVVAAALSDSTSEAAFLRARLPEDAREVLRSTGGALVQRPNLWRQNQMVVYLVAETPQDLVATIEENGADLRYIFNTITRRRVQADMFDKGRQEAVEDQLIEKHGFAVNAQHDYFIAIDTTNFVWLRRVLSDTWRSLFIYDEDRADPSKITPEWIYATRDSLTRQWVQGNLGGWVQIDRDRPLVTENINFLGRYGFETRGLWVMMNQGPDGSTYPSQGGPFVTYTFYDEPTGQIIMIDGMVFAPGYEKREFLRQLEVIAHTFRTQEETDRAEQMAVKAGS